MVCVWAALLTAWRGLARTSWSTKRMLHAWVPAEIRCLMHSLARICIEKVATYATAQTSHNHGDATVPAELFPAHSPHESQFLNLHFASQSFFLSLAHQLEHSGKTAMLQCCVDGIAAWSRNRVVNLCLVQYDRTLPRHNQQRGIIMLPLKPVSQKLLQV